MLEYSQQSLEFVYIDEKRHPQLQLTLQNRSQNRIYYKFKVNRPRYYFVKPDRGFLQVNSSVDINLRLHKNGLEEANMDKFICYSASVGERTSEDQMLGFQQRSDTYKKKFVVKVSNYIPRSDGGPSPGKSSSQLKSIANKGSYMNNSKKIPSTSYQSIIRERLDRVAELKNEIQGIQKSVKDRKIAQGLTQRDTGNSIVPFIIFGVFGLIIGFLSSVWI